MAELVSVVIPVYNAIPYLEECLASVKAQTYPHLEIIMVNDGSTDKSEELLDYYADKFPHFHVYHQANQGLGYTRNRGISLSKGKYLFFLDADDAIPSKAIESLVIAAEKSEADYAVGKVVRFNDARKYIPIRHLEFGLYQKKGQTRLVDHPAMLQDSIACNKLWKKSLLVDNELSFKEGKYYEDLTLTLKAAVLAEKIEVLNKVVYHWRIRDEEDKPSITQQQMKLENTLHRIEALQENRHWLQETEAPKKIVEENDLKSLLDMIRLHAVKFSLIDEVEQEEWVKIVRSFLLEIPVVLTERLPKKEKIIFDLLIDLDLENLKLFSQMLMAIEKEKLVYQESTQFVFYGDNKKIDVTAFLKPVVNVRQVKLENSYWTLRGQLKLPKVSEATTCRFYIKERKSGREIELEPFSSSPSGESLVYPYEEQEFSVMVKATVFELLDNDTAFDFYCSLPEYPNSIQARVRLPEKVQRKESELKIGNLSLKLYRTNYGNLSVQLQKVGATSLLKKFLPFL